MTTHLVHHRKTESSPRGPQISMLALAALFVSLVSLAIGFYLMVKNDSSPLFLLPMTVLGAIAIINLRD